MIRYILLGILQGLTEFLPVSSSGHLVIAQRILGITGNEVATFVVLHLATVLALVVFFWRDIIGLLGNIRLLILIIIVTIITGVIGILGKDFFERLFSQPRWVGAGLIFTGIILILSKKFMAAKRTNLNFKDALVLGLSQGLAIVPGISRSGITISALLFRKVERKTSFYFSFLAAIPAVLGASILELKEIGFVFQESGLNLFLGFVFSFLTGLLALRVLRTILDKARFHYFGYYCICVAILIFIFIK